MSNQLAPEKKSNKITPKDYFRSNEFLGKLVEASGDLSLAKSIVASFLSSYITNPALQATTIESQIVSLVKTASLQLIPNTPLGLAHIVPYNGQATFQIGYQGLVELCRRAGVKVFAQEVYDKDVFKFEIIAGEKKVTHEVVGKDKVIKIYAGWRKGEFYDIVCWDIDRIIEHAKKYSKTYNNPNGAWKNTLNPNVCPVNLWMAKKTVLIDVLKLAPKTIQLAKVIEEDILTDLKGSNEAQIDIYETITTEEVKNEDKVNE